jgi:hypothetical protein
MSQVTIWRPFGELDLLRPGSSPNGVKEQEKRLNQYPERVETLWHCRNSWNDPGSTNAVRVKR